MINKKKQLQLYKMYKNKELISSYACIIDEKKKYRETKKS